jgi:hypothetical protein
MNGTQCGSPALRRRRLCFFHERFRREQRKVSAIMAGRCHYELPLLEDANSVQMALMKVIQLLGSGRIDHRTAGLMLYALQTASVNLRQMDLEANDVTHVVIDRDDVHRTSIDGPQWFEEDFDEEDETEEQAGEAAEDEIEDEIENETENEIEDEADEKVPAAAAPAAAAAAKKVPAPVKNLTLEEARAQVKGAVMKWALESEAQKADVKPPG